MNVSSIPSLTIADGVKATAKPPPIDATSQESLRKGVQEFESFFLSQMLESMFENVPTSGLFGGGPSEEIYRSMMLQEYGRVIAESGGIGIADALARQLLGTQEIK